MLLKPLDRGGALYIDEKREVPISVIENRFEECSVDLSGAIQWVYRESQFKVIYFS